MTTTTTAEPETGDGFELPIVGTWDHDLRHQLIPFVPDIVANLLPVGVTVLYAEPGLGKSMLAQAVEHHVAYGRPFGDWPASDPGRCLIIDLEGDAALTQERGFTMTPWGLLETDLEQDRPTPWTGAGGIFHLQNRTTGDFGIDGRTIDDRWVELDSILTEAADAGLPYRYVRIDTMRDFIGSKPHDTNAYDWDKRWITELNKLAKHHGVGMLLIHHDNKEGKISGSQGISAAGECTISLKRNPENENECILKSEKTRRGMPFRYVVRMNVEGIWQFDTDTHISQAANAGLCRRIADIVKDFGPQTFRQIAGRMSHVAVNAVKAALHRMAGRREIRYYHGAWELVGNPTLPSTAPPKRMQKCSVCHGPMVDIDGAKHHPNCTPPDPIEPADPDDVQSDEEEEDEPADIRWSGTKALTASIAGSKFYAVPVIRAAERTQAPWSLITEKMDGGFDWALPPATVAPEHRVVVLDRNGSFPGVGGSVPVAANVLKHSGALSERGKTAGIYLIDVPRWRRFDVPHPLGKTATSSTRDDGRIWVTTSQLLLLSRLHREGHLERAPEIWDSWTAPVAWSLFSAFAAEVQAERARTYDPTQPGGGEAYIQVKRSSSIAIRGVWPKRRNSPRWRPDWLMSWESEFNVRHWRAQFDAVLARAEILAGHREGPDVDWSLLRMTHTDEVAYLVRSAPADLDLSTWAPDPIKQGTGLGQYKPVKNVLLTDKTRVPSPLTGAQWANVRGNTPRGHR